MKNFPFKKTISIFVLISFIFSDFALGAAPDNISLFKNKKPNYKKITEENEELLNKKWQGAKKNQTNTKFKSESPIELVSLKDISDIHIPENLGRITEVYNSPVPNSKRIIHFQDLHTNYDAQKNSAKLIEYIYKTYGIDLVLSEGALGKIDPSKVRAIIKNKKTLDLTSKILMKSGELTGEEYIALNKDYPIQIWGVENKALYNTNGEQFKNIIKYSSDAQIFLSQVEKAVTSLKPLVYNKEIKQLEEKEIFFNDKKLELNEYLDYLAQVSQKLSLDIYKSYPNLSYLQKSLEIEKSIRPDKIQEELKLYITALAQNLNPKPKNKDLEELNQKCSLFQQQKLSQSRFYSFLKELGNKNNLSINTYKNLNDFSDYLEISSKIDSYKIFQELQGLSEELKYKFCKNDHQKTLITISKNSFFLKDFFNLKVSNEDLEYFLNNKGIHRVEYFKTFLSKAIHRYELQTKNYFIDYNPNLIDNRFQELEDFYKVAWERDKAIIDNGLKRMQDFKEDSAILIVGGFHTKGMTKFLREQNISYAVLSSNAKEGMDDQLYQDLLAGKRKNIEELVPLANEVFKESYRIPMMLDALGIQFLTSA